MAALTGSQDQASGFAGGLLTSEGGRGCPQPAQPPIQVKPPPQIQQGGTNVSFTTNQSGPLEVCVNDDNLTDNTGAWGINILVDESQLP